MGNPGRSTRWASALLTYSHPSIFLCNPGCPLTHNIPAWTFQLLQYGCSPPQPLLCFHSQTTAVTSQSAPSVPDPSPQLTLRIVSGFPGDTILKTHSLVRPSMFLNISKSHPRDLALASKCSHISILPDNLVPSQPSFFSSIALFQNALLNTK